MILSDAPVPYEAQDIAEAVLDAEVRIGQLMAQVPKAKNQYESAVDSGVHSTKAKVIEDAGFTVKQVQRFETLAAHPDIVEQAKAEAAHCCVRTRVYMPILTVQTALFGLLPRHIVNIHYARESPVNPLVKG